MGEYGIRTALAGAVFTFGATKLLAQLFLAYWEFQSAGQSDIAARGIWLLALLLQDMALVSVAAGVAVLVVLTRHSGRSLPARLLPCLAGSTAGALLMFLGVDPTTILLSHAPLGSALGYHMVSSTVAVLILMLGVAMMLRIARPVPMTPAAA